ncbi:MAG: prepilin-type N-terminal cleavage/methylation domain-containing protein [Gemmatimonadota bacterium]
MNRRGFSLVELVVVSAVGGLLLLGLFGTLTTQQHAYTTQTAQMDAAQSVRAGLDVLVTEFRSLSTVGGDVIAMDDDSITVRVMRRVGITCAVTYGGTPQLTAIPVGEHFAVFDSVFVFADGDPDVAFDDTWIAGRVGAADTLGSCSGQMAQRISLPGAAGAFAADSVREGALLRSFEWQSFGLGLYAGKSYLGRWSSTSSFVPLVGPLDASSGPALTLEYFDANGAVTAVPADVRRIDVLVRTAAPVQATGAITVVDSLRATVYARN